MEGGLAETSLRHSVLSKMGAVKGEVDGVCLGRRL